MDDGQDYCVLPSKINNINGHVFKKTTFKKPTYCHHCSEFLWGLALQGVKCLTCSFVSHEKCESSVVTPCSAKAESHVQIPQSHILIKVIDDKKKFCNVCRSKIDDDDAFECEVCSYYIHKTCVKKIVHNCKIYHCYCSYTGNFKCKQHHHWCEGHLPLNAKCKVCQKPCGNVECLTGMRCSWCLTTAHSFCVSEYHQNCSFGALRTIMLPPQVVKRFHLGILTSQPNSPAKVCPCAKEKSRKADHETKVIRICNDNMEEPDIKEVLTDGCTSTADALADVLKKFNIDEEPYNFYLTTYRYGRMEVKLDEEETIWTYVNNEASNCFYLRNINLDRKELTITLHAGLINTNTKSIQMEVNIMSKASSIIINALKQFKLPIENPEKYCITRMKVTPKKVKEVIIQNHESIYDVLVLQRKLSIQELHNTRFYLQPKADEVSELSVYIGNLPNELTKEEYLERLTEALGKWDENMSIAAVFPVSGALVIEFKGLETYSEYSPLLQNLIIDSKKVRVLLLFEIKEDLLPRSSVPLIVYVNSKSGGGQGEKIFVTLKRLLNPYQVIDIVEDGPLPMLYMLREVHKFRILVCGGDGTVGWVLSCLEEIRHRYMKCRDPPTGVLPLGTGNDMSRVLNWGAGYTGESCLEILKQIITSVDVKLDRWTVMFDSTNNEYFCTRGDPVTVVTMNNYFGVGMDAQLSLEFHLSREENPEKFNSRLRNKGEYFKAGLKKLHSSSMANLNDRITLEVDDRIISLPCVEGIAVNNISSWAAGADPWGSDPDPNFKAQSFNDGLLEVIGFTGVYHMGKIKSGISSGIRIAQGSKICIKLKEALPVQVDGEPWMQDPCNILITPAVHQVRMLAKPSATRRFSTPLSPYSRRNEQEDIKHRTTTATDWDTAMNERKP